MPKTFDVTALGELLIDFTENGTSSQGNILMEANPGGAPCNVLAMLSRLGKKTAFMGKVGNDMFGARLEAVLRESGIDTCGLKKDPQVHTTLAFVHNREDGDREFSFYRNPGADMMLEESDLEPAPLDHCRIFHFGSLSMTHEACRKATRTAVLEAKQKGAILSFDPNLRENLWESLDEAKEQILWGLEHCQILKIADNEVQQLMETEDLEEGIRRIRKQFDIPLVLLSMGKEGSRAYSRCGQAEYPAFIQKTLIDTTGAGDTFCACVLNYVLDHGWKDYEPKELEEMLRFANGAAALITTRRGALRVMPERREIEALLAEASKGGGTADE